MLCIHKISNGMRQIAGMDIANRKIHISKWAWHNPATRSSSLNYPVVTNCLAVHRLVTRGAVGVLLVDLLVDRSGNVRGSGTVIKNRSAAVPVGFITLSAAEVTDRYPALAVGRLDGCIHVHVVDTL